jgi:hypothetical protein
MSGDCLNCGRPTDDGEEIDLLVMKGIICRDCREHEMPEEVEIEWDDGTSGVYGASEKGRK